MGSVPRRRDEDNGRCDNCGAYGALRYGVCDRCHDLIIRRVPPPEENFAQLFEAARLLLNEGIGEEDRIIPTLAFAGWSVPSFDITSATRERFERIGGADADEVWAREVDAFVARYGSLRPVRLKDGVLILERLPASVEVRRGYPDARDGWGVWIHIYHHRRVAKPEHIAALYGKALEKAGMRHDTETMGSFHPTFESGVLQIVIGRGFWPSRDRGEALIRDFSFPRPHLVETICRALLTDEPAGAGFAKRLRPRAHGKAPDAEPLILACVAYFLKNYRPTARGRKGIHALLNDQLLFPTGRPPLEIGYSASKTNQLWRDVNHETKVRRQLADVERALFSSKRTTADN